MDKERKNPDHQSHPNHPDPSGNTGDTIRIRRPPRVFTTVLGQNIWMGDVEPCDLELERHSSSNPYDSATVDDPWTQVKP